MPFVHDANLVPSYALIDEHKVTRGVVEHSEQDALLRMRIFDEEAPGRPDPGVPQWLTGKALENELEACGWTTAKLTGARPERQLAGQRVARLTDYAMVGDEIILQSLAINTDLDVDLAYLRCSRDGHWSVDRLPAQAKIMSPDMAHQTLSRFVQYASVIDNVPTSTASLARLLKHWSGADLEALEQILICRLAHPRVQLVRDQGAPLAF